MTQLLSLAWRNIWRKKRRSLTALLSVAFALLLAINFRSLGYGSYGKMIEAAVSNSGYVQVHAAGYWVDKSINDLLPDSPALRAKLTAAPGVTGLLPHLQNFALAAGDQTSKGALVLGIAPGPEDQFNHLSRRVTKGRYLTEQDAGVLVTEGLAQYLKLSVGDTLVLVGQGYHASVAAGKYPIVGLVRHLNPQLNRQLVYLPLPLAQRFNSAEGHVSAFLLNARDNDDVPPMLAGLHQTLGANYEIMPWHEMQPEVQQGITTDTTIATLMLSCLYLVVGFGIVGTVLMMAMERRREFGMLQAIGLQKSQIQQLVVLESLLLGLLGTVLAFVLALPVVRYFNANPIPLTGEGAKAFEAMGVEPVIILAVKPFIFFFQAGVVFAILLVACVFPVLLIRRLRMSEVIR